MSYLEELLPEFRKGAKIRLAHWNKGKFIILKEDAIVDNDNYEYPLSIPETLSNQWEFYKGSIDWDYIIKNKCLCLFGNETMDFCGFLEEIDEEVKHKFIMLNCEGFRNCRPVRRDEVTFYEDRKDE